MNIFLMFVFKITFIAISAIVFSILIEYVSDKINAYRLKKFKQKIGEDGVEALKELGKIRRNNMYYSVGDYFRDDFHDRVYRIIEIRTTDVLEDKNTIRTTYNFTLRAEDNGDEFNIGLSQLNKFYTKIR